MKKIYVIISLFAVAFSSCSKWLDVKSEFDIYEESMFENQYGFFNALNGLYMEMSNSSLYGANLTYGAMEAWSRNYILNPSSFEDWYDLSNFKYENKGPISLGENLWLKGYFVIANANNLIQNIEKTEVPFLYGDKGKNMIKAEAYAIRAMMHFEMLRIFAKAPIIDDGGNSAYIPYVDIYPSVIAGNMSTKKILNKIVEDLIKAKELIKPMDVDADGIGYLSYKNIDVNNRIRLTTSRGSGNSNVDANEFFLYRGNRLNYYAITQLLARVALYKGDNELALLNAKEIIDVIENGIHGGAKPYVFTPIGFINNPITTDTELHPRLHQEIIFGLYKEKYYEYTKNFFGNVASEKHVILNGANVIFSENNDCRYKTIIDGVRLSKFYCEGNTSNDVYMKLAQDIIPVMRFIEAYYIAAEAAFDINKAEAIAIFNKAIKGRANDAYYSLDETVSKEQFNKAIIDEYQREFLCEGHLVFVYKRLNAPIRDNVENVENNGILTLPTPKTQNPI